MSVKHFPLQEPRCGTGSVCHAQCGGAAAGGPGATVVPLPVDGWHVVQHPEDAAAAFVGQRGARCPRDTQPEEGTTLTARAAVARTRPLLASLQSEHLSTPTPSDPYARCADFNRVVSLENNQYVNAACLTLCSTKISEMILFAY